jgi:hypothetical protein
VLLGNQHPEAEARRDLPPIEILYAVEGVHDDRVEVVDNAIKEAAAAVNTPEEDVAKRLLQSLTPGGIANLLLVSHAPR